MKQKHLARMVNVSSEHLFHSPNNPRRQPTEKDAKVVELSESIQAVGLLQPIIASKVGPFKHFIIAGARRFEAAKLAGMGDIPCLVYDDLATDEELAMTVTENLQRQDLTPLEEGRGIASLLEAGRSTDEIAADIAKSPTWVRRRAKLAELSSDWQAKLEDPRFVHFGAAHLEYVAQFPETIQNKILDDILQCGPENITLQRMKRIISEHLQYLAEAKFDTKDCKAKCQHRSDMEPDLFADVKPYGDEPDDDCRCLNPECWDKKIAQWQADIVKKAAKKTKQEPYKLTESYSAPREDQSGRTLKYYDVNVVEEGAPGAVPAVYIDGARAGDVVWIENPADGRGEPEESGKNKYVKPEATLEQKRLHHQLTAFELWRDSQQDCPEHLRNHALLLLAAIAVGLRNFGDPAERLGLFYDLSGSAEDDLIYNRAWGDLRAGGLKFYIPTNPAAIDDIADATAELMLSLKICGIDPKDYQKAAVKAFPDTNKTTGKCPTKKGAKK